MVRRSGLVAAWLAVTLLAVFVAGRAVSGVRDQVTASEATLPRAVAAAATTIPGSVPPDTTGPSASSQPAGTGDTTVTSGVPPTSSPDAPGASTTTATTAPSQTAPSTSAAPTTSPTPTTTSTTVAAYETTQYQLVGGVVRLRSRPGEVHVVAATPNPGYEVEIKKAGPTSVEVEFDSLDEGYEGRLHAEWRDGRLAVDVEESGERDD